MMRRLSNIRKDEDGSVGYSSIPKRLELILHGNYAVVRFALCGTTLSPCRSAFVLPQSHERRQARGKLEKGKEKPHQQDKTPRSLEEPQWQRSEAMPGPRNGQGGTGRE